MSWNQKFRLIFTKLPGGMDDASKYCWLHFSDLKTVIRCFYPGSSIRFTILGKTDISGDFIIYTETLHRLLQSSGSEFRFGFSGGHLTFLSDGHECTIYSIDKSNFPPANEGRDIFQSFIDKSHSIGNVNVHSVINQIKKIWGFSDRSDGYVTISMYENELIGISPGDYSMAMIKIPFQGPNWILSLNGRQNTLINGLISTMKEDPVIRLHSNEYMLLWTDEDFTLDALFEKYELEEYPEDYNAYHAGMFIHVDPEEILFIMSKGRAFLDRHQRDLKITMHPPNGMTLWFFSPERGESIFKIGSPFSDEEGQEINVNFDTFYKSMMNLKGEKNVCVGIIEGSSAIMIFTDDLKYILAYY